MSASLEVNECRVFATASGSEWWSMFRQHWNQPAGRITVLSSTLGGELVSVACYDLEHAEWLRDTAISNGIPSAALKVRKVAAA